MKELRKYVERLFENQPKSEELKDLKEEILSNMLAKKNDLISQGMDEEEATRLAKESMPSLDGVIEENNRENTEINHKSAGVSAKVKGIIGIIICAVFGILVIVSVISSANKKKESDYFTQQSDALTHDIAVVEEYRGKYVGDMSLVSGLFYELPLNHVGMKFEIDSSKCELTVNYMETVWNIGEELVYRNLVYNTAAAMASIDNLMAITYNFPGDSFTFKRDRIEAILGVELIELQEETVWKEKVQSQLGSDEFVDQFYQ